MKVRLGKYIVEHNDFENIRNCVALYVNQHLEVEYIDYEYAYADRKCTKPIVTGTDIPYQYYLNVAYSTIDSPYGKICDALTTIRVRTKELFNKLLSDYIIISQQSIMAKESRDYIYPPKFNINTYIIGEPRKTDYPKEAKEMEAICNLCGISIQDIPDYELSRVYFKFFVHGSIIFTSTKDKAEWLKSQKMNIFAEYNYFNSFQWKFKKMKSATGLSQTELSEALRIPKRTLANWESGICSPDESTRQAVLAQLTNIFISSK